MGFLLQCGQPLIDQIAEPRIVNPGLFGWRVKFSRTHALYGTKRVMPDRYDLKAERVHRLVQPVVDDIAKRKISGLSMRFARF